MKWGEKMVLGKKNIAVDEITNNKFKEIQQVLKERKGKLVNQDESFKIIVDVAYASIVEQQK